MFWLSGLVLAGCSIVNPPLSSPPPTFRGPNYLHGTIGSLTSIRGHDQQLVSGPGLVVGLPPGAGSIDAPAPYHQWTIDQLRRGGFGDPSIKFGDTNMGAMTPEHIIASGTTAPVMIEGLIPAGAIVGTRFDVLVTALPHTQTTSLDGGRLYPFDLTVGGSDPNMQFYHALARASGPMYLNPFEDENQSKLRIGLERQAIIVSGGVVTEARKIELFLNQPSWQRSRMIADTINERFPRDPDIDTEDVANAINDQIIDLHIPKRYADKPDDLLQLINHLFLQRAQGFEADEAQRLADLLVLQKDYAFDVTLCWQTLGKTALPVIRKYYDSPLPYMQRAALGAGARLGDPRTVDYLADLAKDQDFKVRQQAAELLVFLPHSVLGADVLSQLLDDDVPDVRISAYESLAEVGDPMIQRHVFGEHENFKLVLDLVPAEKGFVYITQAEVPRIAIFNPMLGFKTSTVARLWENRFMMRVSDGDQPITAFYQKPGDPEHPRQYTFQPTVANMVFLMAHKPTLDDPTEGLDLTYSQIVKAVYRLCQTGEIPAGFKVQLNPLARLIAAVRDESDQTIRAETESTHGHHLGHPETSTPATQPSVEPANDLGHNPPTTSEGAAGEQSVPQLTPSP